MSMARCLGENHLRTDFQLFFSMCFVTFRLKMASFGRQGWAFGFFEPEGVKSR